MLRGPLSVDVIGKTDLTVLSGKTHHIGINAMQFMVGKQDYWQLSITPT